MHVYFLILIYGPTQAHIYGFFTDRQILQSNIISLLILLSVFPLVGKLSDRVNREKIVVIARLGFLILAQPFFYAISRGNYTEYIIMQALISIPAGAYYATVPVILSELFPINLRCTVLSILYSIAASLSAGLSPLLSLILLNKSNFATSPSLLTVILVILSIWLINKSRKNKEVMI